MIDRLFNIAVGSSRTAKVWKNQKLTKADFVDRLRTPTRTQETLAEYNEMPKAKRAELKDVGGFVGGYCRNGKRTDVTSRDLLTLDIDYPKTDVWSAWIDYFGNAAVLYSTHSHTPDSPRYRLVIFLNRTVTPEEYEAVGRKIADTIDFESFDETTFQVQRLMYWPSCSRDAKYVFEECPGDLIDVDSVLAQYHDWHDVSSWRTSKEIAQLLPDKDVKQQDPLEKTGPVGTFCRAYYPIQTAIEEFIPFYVPCDGGRYTYSEGSTVSGVVIYDDKYSYSNHATDPASGQLCNAFDLVRIHKFGKLDADKDPNTPPNKLPSWKAMLDFCGTLDAFKVQDQKDRRSEAADFDDLSEADTDWTKKLKYHKNVLEQTIENAYTILSYDPKLKDRIAYDEMGNREVVIGDLPWAKLPEDKTVRRWSDFDDSQLRAYMERIGLQGKERINDAFSNYVSNHSVHPVRRFVESAAWDGTPRVETLFVDYLGAEDTPYTRAVTRKTLAGAIARIYKPGCKFDYTLCLRGPQGIGKSSILYKLAGEWFSDSLVTMTGKEAFEQINGIWIVEIGELASMKRSEIEGVKSFLSAQKDKYRPAYAHRVKEFPRQCIFIATTNESFFLRDKTGNRRFWPLECKNQPAHNWSDLDGDTIHQIWAEAKVIYDKGETLYLERELEKEAEAMQENFSVEDPLIASIADYLDRRLPEDWSKMGVYNRREWLQDPKNKGTLLRTTVCAKEIACELMNIDPGKVTVKDTMPINDILANKIKGWKKPSDNEADRLRIPLYSRQRYYLREGYTSKWVKESDAEEEDDDFLL